MPLRKMARSNGSFAFNCLPKGFCRFTIRGSDSATPCRLPPDFLIIRSSLPDPHQKYPSESDVGKRVYFGSQLAQLSPVVMGKT